MKQYEERLLRFFGDNVSVVLKTIWALVAPLIAQSAEKGSWPEVMCATEEGLEQRALYGPTGRAQFVGPVGKGTLNAHAYDKAVMAQLWEVSEAAVGFTWQFDRRPVRSAP